MFQLLSDVSISKQLRSDERLKRIQQRGEKINELVDGIELSYSQTLSMSSRRHWEERGVSSVMKNTRKSSAVLKRSETK